MQDNLKKLLKKEMTRKNFLHLIAVGIIGILGFGGVISYLLAHASTPAVSEEAEDGTLNSNATVGSDSNASGGEYVKFGTAPSGGGSGSPVPMMSEYASYVLAPGGDFEFAQMATSSGQLPTGPWELTVAGQDSAESTQTLGNMSILNGTGLILQVSSQSQSSGIDTNPLTAPGGGFGITAPYYREFECIIPNDGSEVVNHPSSWTLTTRQGDDASICGEIDIIEGGWGINAGTLHTGTGSGTSAYGPDMGVQSGSHKYGVYVTSTDVTWYEDGAQLSPSPVAFPQTIPTDAVWFPLLCNAPAGGNDGTTGPTVTGAAGQYVIAYERWFIPG